MAVRLKYAGVPESRIVIESDPQRALSEAVERSASTETVFVLPTYTAMLEVRDVLRQAGSVTDFWRD
jgi:lipid II isoglutaminyl synthase (glutamine-hydrolysing)